MQVSDKARNAIFRGLIFQISTGNPDHTSLIENQLLHK